NWQVAILDHGRVEVKMRRSGTGGRWDCLSAFSLGWREHDRFVQLIDVHFTTPAKDGECKVKACSCKQDVLWDHPEPLADIQSGKKCRHSGHQVKVRQAVVKESWQPDFLGREFFETAGQVLRRTWIDLLGCSSRYHWRILHTV